MSKTIEAQMEGAALSALLFFAPLPARLDKGRRTQPQRPTVPRPGSRHAPVDESSRESASRSQFAYQGDESIDH